MGKRKRPSATADSVKSTATTTAPETPKKHKATAQDSSSSSSNNNSLQNGDGAVHLQLVAGCYEKILHGCLVTIPAKSLEAALNSTKQEKSSDVDLDLPASFSDSFLFTAHTAPLRCVALSPEPQAEEKNGPQAQKRFLASASPDEKINLYTLSSTISPPKAKQNDFGIPGAESIRQSIRKPSSIANKHLGTLHEHTNTVTTLVFTPSRTKLISAGEDNQILIWRVRDWSLLSTLKVPKPKAAVNAGIGALGGAVTGVNDLAIHPSQKILLSVSKGERCMRMWNLMTGKKAGVLAWTRDQVPNAIGGVLRDGRRICWNEKGNNFAVGFERGALVFGETSEPIARLQPNTKVHQMRYIKLPMRDGDDKVELTEVLALATEDGRVLFYTIPEASKDKEIKEISPIAQLGGLAIGMVTRIKDFKVLRSQENFDGYFIATACSDGTLRVWLADPRSSSTGSALAQPNGAGANGKPANDVKAIPHYGTVLGIYETGRRITSLDGMVVTVREGEEEDEDIELEDAEDSEDEDDDEDESDDSEE